MREQESPEVSEEHPAATLTGRTIPFRPYSLAAALDAAQSSSYSLDLVLRNISLMRQIDHVVSTSKTARSKPSWGKAISNKIEERLAVKEEVASAVGHAAFLACREHHTES